MRWPIPLPCEHRNGRCGQWSLKLKLSLEKLKLFRTLSEVRTSGESQSRAMTRKKVHKGEFQWLDLEKALLKQWVHVFAH